MVKVRQTISRLANQNPYYIIGTTNTRLTYQNPYFITGQTKTNSPNSAPGKTFTSKPTKIFPI
jgi:hypothetical protein